MNDTQISSFVLAARTLSFTEAAERLYISQQAVSSNIINLEKELGATFFRRDPRRLSLTVAGEYYFDYFQRYLLELEQTCGEVERRYAGLAKSFAVGYSIWIDPLGKLDEGVSSFVALNPGVTFSGYQYQNGKLLEELAENRLDVALISEAQVTWISEFEKAAVAYEDICLYAPQYVEGDGPDSGLWGLPVLFNASREWSYFEWKQMLAKDLGSLGVETDRVSAQPNVQSLFAELAVGDCVVVSDNNFGHAGGYANMRRFHVDSSSRLFCLWNGDNENPLIGSFVEHMRSTFDYGEAQAK